MDAVLFFLNVSAIGIALYYSVGAAVFVPSNQSFLFLILFYLLPVFFMFAQCEGQVLSVSVCECEYLDTVFWLSSTHRAVDQTDVSLHIDLSS